MNGHSALREITRRELHPNIGLKEASRTQVLTALEALLADEFVLYTKTLNFHWNVTGPRFNDLHKFLEEQYRQLQDMVDSVAERSRHLGGRALGTLKEFSAKARLEESERAPKADQMLMELGRDHETVIRTLREDVEECGRLGDQGTMDFLTGLMAAHEKMAWMLRSFAA